MSATSGFDKKDRIEVLAHLYEQMHEYIRHNEEMENKVAFAVSGLLLVFCGLVLRSSFGSIANTERIFITAFIVVFTVLACTFLWMNHATLLWQRKTVVRVEHLFGFYQPDEFKGSVPFDLSKYPGGTCMKTVLPPKGAEWGNLGLFNRSSILPHFSGLLLSGIATIATLWVVPVAPQQAGGVATTGNSDMQHVGSVSSVGIPDHLDIILHQPDIALSTIQKSTPDQGINDRITKLEKDVQKLIGEKGGTAPTPLPRDDSPPAAPAYVIFFDSSQVSLSSVARQTVAQAANSGANAKSVLCNGYSDASGNPSANMRLSLLRAANVATELVRDGVPVEKITVHGYGTRPAGRTVGIVIQ